jgi:hypothetical protein
VPSSCNLFPWSFPPKSRSQRRHLQAPYGRYGAVSPWKHQDTGGRDQPNRSVVVETGRNTRLPHSLFPRLCSTPMWPAGSPAGQRTTARSTTMLSREAHRHGGRGGASIVSPPGHHGETSGDGDTNGSRTLFTPRGVCNIAQRPKIQQAPDDTVL